MPSYLALILILPLSLPGRFLYALPEYMLRVLVTGVFSGNPDTLITTRSFATSGRPVPPEILGGPLKGRSLEITSCYLELTLRFS